MNALTGGRIWNYTTGGAIYSSPMIAGNSVYFGSDDGNLYSLTATTGLYLGSYTTLTGIESSPAVVGGSIYFGCDNNMLYCLALSE